MKTNVQKLRAKHKSVSHPLFGNCLEHGFLDDDFTVFLTRVAQQIFHTKL